MRVSWSTPRPRLQVPHAEEGLCTWLPEEGSLESLSWVSGRCLLPCSTQRSSSFVCLQPRLPCKDLPIKSPAAKEIKNNPVR